MSSEQTSRSTKATILVVDDTPADVRLLTRMLEKRGYRVHTAYNGRLALEFAQASQPDLILLDVVMPDMSGYEICEKLKADEQTRPIPRIFISALDEAADKVKGFELGAADYITKPFQAAEVLARVETHLALRGLQKSLQEKNALLEQKITEREQAEEKLRTQKRLFENLVAVARATVERPTLEGTLQNTLDVAVALTDAAKGSVFLLDGNGTVTHSILARSDVRADQRQAIIGRVMDKGLAGWVLQHRKPALVTDTLQDERWVDLPEADLARSVLAIPILSGPIVMGILTLVHPQAAHFGAEHLELMQAATDQMALAVRNAQAFDELRHMADRQITLYEALRSLSGQLDPDAVVRTSVDAITKFVGWSNVALIVPDENRQRLVVHTSIGKLSPALGLQLPTDKSFIGRAFTTATTQWVSGEDVDSNPDVRSKLVVPIKRGGHVLGVLNMDSAQLDAFDPDDVLLAESLAEAVALALDNASLFQATQNERSRLQAIITSSRDGIIFVSLDRRLRVINETALQLLRLPGSSQDWLENRLNQALSLLRRTAPAVVRVTLAEMRRIQKGDEPPGEGEYDVPPHTIHWVNLPVMIGDTPLGRLLILRDVSDERAVERLREDMTRTMVHDLRNPLTSIVTSFTLLSNNAFGELSDQQGEIVEMAQRNALRMKELVNSILDVSRLESGQMPVEYAAFSLAELISDDCRMQAALAGDTDVHLECDVPDRLPQAWADASLISRVLQNLVGNALKFTPGGGRVRVTARHEKKRGASRLLVSVSDTGPGVPAEIQGRLFQKFVAGRQAGSGSGLGLAFCKLAIEAHSQRIWLESKPSGPKEKGGATFTFSLAIAK
ncbi:MAG: GAF domain-containing protein [Thermoflexales bacterium]|nr:GAF domain-containing protein [Thermoflexales bacterium]